MRIIRTEMYFDEEQVRGYEPFRSRPPREGSGKNPGVAFLWIKGEVDGLPDIENSKDFEPLPGRRAGQPDGEALTDQVRGILDLFIKDSGERDFLRIPSASRLENRALVDFILEQDIVMEHSPPFAISFKALLNTKNSPLWIGTYIGAEMAWDHPLLMILTVPSGIIVVSSALGIGTAMQAGLNKAIKRLFDKSSP
jgi:hypothetical protein